MIFFIFSVYIIAVSQGDLIGYNRGQNNVNLQNMHRFGKTRRHISEQPRSEMYKLLLKYLSEE